MTAPLVSVLLPVYNSQRTLARCLASIAQQTYAPLEVIAIDDSSTDGSAALLRAFAQHHPCRIIAQPTNQGLARSLNAAVPYAQGAYVARLDADDEWATDKIERQVQFLEAHPAVGVLGTWYINRTGDRQQKISRPITHAAIARRIYWLNPFGHSCVMIRTALLREVPYDPAIRYGQDYDLWLRLLPRTELHNLPAYLCTRHVPLTPNRSKQRAQMQQMVRTITTNAYRNGAGLQAYFGVLVPLTILLTPTWLKRLRA